MAAMPRRRWPSSPRRGSTPTSSPPAFRRRGRRPSPTPGATCSRRSSPSRPGWPPDLLAENCGLATAAAVASVPRREMDLHIRRTLLVPIVVALTALALPGAAFGGPGDLDPSFDGDGKLTTAFGTTPFHAADRGNASARG